MTEEQRAALEGGLLGLGDADGLRGLGETSLVKPAIRFASWLPLLPCTPSLAPGSSCGRGTGSGSGQRPLPRPAASPTSSPTSASQCKGLGWRGFATPILLLSAVSPSRAGRACGAWVAGTKPFLPNSFPELSSYLTETESDFGPGLRMMPTLGSSRLSPT